jgi:hypothetical protein
MPFLDRRNKEVKIGELAPHLDSHRIFLKYPKEQWTPLEEQITAFPFSRRDDRLESLWMAVKKAETAMNPYTEWDGSAYDFSSAGLHQKSERPQSVFMSNNPYSNSMDKRRR